MQRTLLPHAMQRTQLCCFQACVCELPANALTCAGLCSGSAYDGRTTDRQASAATEGRTGALYQSNNLLLLSPICIFLSRFYLFPSFSNLSLLLSIFVSLGFGDIYSVQLSVTPTDERTCVTDTCSIFTEDPFPLCFSRTTSNNKQLLPTAGLCFRAPPLLLLWGFPLSVLPHRPSPLAVLASRLVPAFMHTPDRCLFEKPACLASLLLHGVGPLLLTRPALSSSP